MLDMLIESPESRREFDVWVPDIEILEKSPDLLNEESNTMTIRWNSDRLIWDQSRKVTISIWGYQEKTDSLYPSLKFIADIVKGVQNNGQYELNFNELKDLVLDRYDYHFGFLAVNLTDTEFTITQWSKPMPLGIFFITIRVSERVVMYSLAQAKDKQNVIFN
jgi:hypothetical protein